MNKVCLHYAYFKQGLLIDCVCMLDTWGRVPQQRGDGGGLCDGEVGAAPQVDEPLQNLCHLVERKGGGRG